jgi:hypothetical protein
MTMVPVFFSKDDASTTAAIGDFVARLGASSYWNAATGEYGIGPASAGTPVRASSADDPPATIDDSAVQAWLEAKLNADDPAFGPASQGTAFVLFYPAGVTVTFDGAQSCSSFRGYHEEVTLDASHGGVHVPYAVVARCAVAADAGASGVVDEATQVASHEMVEVATDPFPVSNPAYLQVDDAHFYWTEVLGGSELGDMCTRASGAVVQAEDMPYAVQRTWSNAAASAGHDPCVPAPSGQPYFDAAPALDVVTTLVSGTQVKASGVHVSVGQSATVQVRLFSDGPTGPWTVSARPALGWAGELDFSFDRTTGINGDVLTMTVHVLHAGRFDREPFVVTSQLGGVEKTWIGLVTN